MSKELEQIKVDQSDHLCREARGVSTGNTSLLFTRRDSPPQLADYQSVVGAYEGEIEKLQQEHLIGYIVDLIK